MAAEIHYEWGDDFPEDLSTLFLLHGRADLPFHMDAAPMVMLKQIQAAAAYKKPEKKTPRTGVRNPNAGRHIDPTTLLQSPDKAKETENELKMRAEAQVDVQVHILPKSETEGKEAAEMYLRRLNTHREAPEALVLPMQKGETRPGLVARMLATTKSSNPNCLVLPKAATESDGEYDARIALVAKTESPLILARGKHETAGHFDQRMKAQAACIVPIMPRSEGESGDDFTRRCDMQKKVRAGMIHNFDSKRENAQSFAKRLDAQKEMIKSGTPGRPLLPGDENAVKSIVKEAAVDISAEEVAQKMTEKEEAKKAAAEEKLKEEARASAEQALRAAIEDSASVSAKIAASDLSSSLTDAKAAGVAQAMLDEATQRLEELRLAMEQEKEAEEKAKVEAAAAAVAPKPPSNESTTVDISSIGFKALKDLMIEHGIPEKEVKAAPQKFALKEIAEKYPESGIKFA